MAKELTANQSVKMRGQAPNEEIVTIEGATQFDLDVGIMNVSAGRNVIETIYPGAELKAVVVLRA